MVYRNMKKNHYVWGYSFYFSMSKGAHMLPSSFLAARSFPKGHRTKKIDLQTSLRTVTKYLALKITSISRGCIVLLYIVFSSFTTKVNISTTVSQRIALSPAVYIQLHKRHSGVTRRSIICLWAFVWEKKNRGEKPFQLIKKFDTRGSSDLNVFQMYFRTEFAVNQETNLSWKHGLHIW